MSLQNMEKTHIIIPTEKGSLVANDRRNFVRLDKVYRYWINNASLQEVNYHTQINNI